VSLPVRGVLALAGSSEIRLRQVLVWLGLGFSFSLFWLWLPHLLTAVLYLLGMSQKEWVDLMSQPGWFQTLYLVLTILALLGGFLSVNLSLTRRKQKGKAAGFLAAGVGFLFWLVGLAIFLR